MNPLELRGEAQATLGDGTVLTLVFDNEAWITIEEVTVLAWQEVLARMIARAQASRPLELKIQRALLFGATRDHHADLTLDQCGVLAQSEGAALSEPLGRAMNGSIPWKEPESGEAQPAETPAKTLPGAGTKRCSSTTKPAAPRRPSGKKRQKVR